MNIVRSFGILVAVGVGYIAMITPAHARFLSVQLSPGVGGAEAMDRFALGVAGTFWVIGEGPVQVGVRPAFDWHNLHMAEDLFFTVNAEVAFSLGESIQPSVFVGGGVNHVVGGTDLAALIAGGGISEGQLAYLLGQGVVQPGTGGALNLGVDVRIFAGEHFYIVPGFSYTRGLGETAANNYQATVGLGAAF